MTNEQMRVYGSCQFKSGQAVKDYFNHVERTIGPSDWGLEPIYKGKGKRGNGLNYLQLREEGWATLEDLLWTHELGLYKTKGKHLTYGFSAAISGDDQKVMVCVLYCLRALKPFVREAEWEYSEEERGDMARYRIVNGVIEESAPLWGEYRPAHWLAENANKKGAT